MRRGGPVHSRGSNLKLVSTIALAVTCALQWAINEREETDVAHVKTLLRRVLKSYSSLSRGQPSRGVPGQVRVFHAAQEEQAGDSMDGEPAERMTIPVGRIEMLGTQ